MKKLLLVLLAACALFAGFGAFAQEATIRKNLAARIPKLSQIDEIKPSGMPGLWEVRADGSHILYTDSEGNFLIEGALVDTRSGINLTEQRVGQLTAVDFDTLPVADAFTIVKGNGKRKMAVFEDPNCIYCKHLEGDLQKIDNVTIHVFLFPILGPDSVEKSRDIWCSRDKGKIWTEWMTKTRAIPPSTNASCDTSALNRNVEYGIKHKITGTPTLLFADNTRISSALNADQVEKFLSGIK